MEDQVDGDELLTAPSRSLSGALNGGVPRSISPLARARPKTHTSGSRRLRGTTPIPPRREANAAPEDRVPASGARSETPPAASKDAAPIAVKSAAPRAVPVKVRIEAAPVKPEALHLEDDLDLHPHFFKAHSRIILGSAVAAVLLGAISILWWLNTGKTDPQGIQRELQAEIDRLNAIPVDRILERDEQAHSLLENEVYLRYGGETRQPLVRLHETLHAQASVEKKGREKVKPFLARYEALKSSPDRPREEAEKLLDEGRSLREQFGSTPFGPRIEEAISGIEKVLGSETAGSWATEFISMKQECDRAAGSSDFTRALKVVDDFAGSHPPSKDLDGKLVELKDSLKRKAEAKIDALVREAERLTGKGQRTEAASLIRGARAGFQGLPSAWKLEKYLREEP